MRCRLCLWGAHCCDHLHLCSIPLCQITVGIIERPSSDSQLKSIADIQAIHSALQLSTGISTGMFSAVFFVPFSRLLINYPSYILHKDVGRRNCMITKMQLLSSCIYVGCLILCTQFISLPFPRAAKWNCPLNSLECLLCLVKSSDSVCVCIHAAMLIFFMTMQFAEDQTIA